MRKTMKKKGSFIYIFLIIFFIVSISTIYSAQSILSDFYSNLYIKQIIWYIVGFVFMLIINRIGKSYVYKICFFIYIVLNILLLGLLFFGNYVNGARCWYNILGFGFQPSEFMKITLIILIGVMINNYNKKKNHTNDDEFKLILSVFVITLIPSILTFLEPDTGNVIIYFIIMVSMLFTSGINKKWFIFMFLILFIFIFGVLIFYHYFNDLFIKIFGSSFSLRLNRIFSWKNLSGYQLTNGLSSIGSAGLFGYGFRKTPLYFPEAQTDFIFAVFASNYGFIGSLLLICLIMIFDLKLINLAYKKHGITKYVIIGMVSMMFYQQFQNIGMTIGILPITGITLPFISYGGSSLISYFIILAFCI